MDTRTPKSSATARPPGPKAVNGRPTLHPDEVESFVRGEHGNPFATLGPHAVPHAGPDAVPHADPDGQGDIIAIRAFRPGASAIRVRMGRRSFEMSRLHESGFFEALLTGVEPQPRYKLEIAWPGGTTEVGEDPYRFGTILSDFDIHLFNEGTLEALYDRLGAHPAKIEGAQGVRFAVWAPNAHRVSVIGPWNSWDGRVHPMRLRGTSGLWEIFLPGLEAGALYKYEIRTRNPGEVLIKTDPVGSYSELRPGTSSIVVRDDAYRWRDREWMDHRPARQALDRPMSVYEVHVGSWRREPDPQYPAGRWLTWPELAEQLVPYAVEMGFTHLQLMPVSEHPFDGSWGYQTSGYFAPTSRFGTPDELRAFVDAAHRAGLGVLLDWVPAHFPKDPPALEWFDGSHLYEHADPRQGHHPDWGTLIFNYGRAEVQEFLISSALSWLERYHIDGLRVDAVASMLYLDYSRQHGEWIPNRYGGRENLEAIDFLRRFNDVVHARHPGTLTVAEESTAWPGVSRPTHLGGLGFDLKWNMGWMHDTLYYMHLDPVFRKWHQDKLTFTLYYAFHENFMLPLSHDEVVHGKGALLSKMPGDTWQRFANLRALYALMFGHPGKKLLFMGGEFGQWREWSHEGQLDWHLLGEGHADYPMHRGVQRLVRDLNRVHAARAPLHEVDFHWDGFRWVDFHDAESSVVAFERRGRDPNDVVIVVANLTPVVRPGYRVGVPHAGPWRELINTDLDIYGGGNVGQPGGVTTEFVSWHGQPQSLLLTLPPLGVLFMEPAR